MTALSINLPDELAIASHEAAGEMGISRTQFIRQAIMHEIENYRSRLEMEAIVRSISAMKKSKRYLMESEEIIKQFDSDSGEDEGAWWTVEND